MEHCDSTQKKKQPQLEPGLLKRIIYLSALAPSADNNQPWRFELDDQQLDLHLVPDRCLKSDRRKVYDYMSLGMLIKNLRIAAKEQGLNSEIDLLPNGEQQSPAARIQFESCTSNSDQNPFFHFLSRRRTNRRFYSKKPLAAECDQALAAIGKTTGLSWEHTSAKKSIKRLAKAVATADGLRMRYPSFQQELAAMMRFNRKQAMAANDGILIDSLELPLGGKHTLHVVKSWRLLRLFNYLGFASGTAAFSRQQVCRSAAVGILWADRESISSYLKAGELFQEIWLTLTKHGAALHPLAALPIFIDLAKDSESILREADRSRLLLANKAVEGVFPAVKGKIPLMLFRMGYAKDPGSTSSYRLPLDQIISGQSSAPAGVFNYRKAFSRNIGLVSPAEQERLEQTTVAIPGMGGVGGVHLVTLARMGIGGFHIADFDQFSISNFNRQYGAAVSTLDRDKVEVMSDIVKDINPAVRLKVWSEPISAENSEDFLKGSNVVVDSIDAFSVEARRVVFNQAREMKIPVITAGPIGMSCALVNFTPSSMPFDSYFNIKDGMSDKEKFAHFIIGLIPHLAPLSYIQREEINQQERYGPSLSAAVMLCAGFAGFETLKMILERGKVYASPYYHYYDPYLMKFKRDYLMFANRSLLQRLKCRLLLRKL